jgi:hypothetical protein
MDNIDSATKAQYSTENLPLHYQGNPLIECLPPIRNHTDVALTLLSKPNVSLIATRGGAAHMRLHYIDQLEGLYIPRPEIITLESELSVMIRRGLMQRNPFSIQTTKYLYDLRAQMKATVANNNTLAGAFFVVALSGSGKTRGVRAVLEMYPKAIVHERYNGRPFKQTQVVWLSVDAPISGSIRGLLLRLFHALDEAIGYEGKHSYTAQFTKSRLPYDKQIEYFAQAAATHFVGVIHIDDLQRVWEGRRVQRDIIFGFIIQLANTARIPLLLSGTHKATALISDSLEAARRTVASGHIELTPPNSPDDPFFTTLVTTLFKYQWIDVPLVLDVALKRDLWNWSRGIPAVVNAIYIQGQKMAIREGGKTFTKAHLEAAYRGPLKVLHPALNALRQKDAHSLQRYQDLLPTEVQMRKALLTQSGQKFDTRDLMDLFDQHIN